MLNWRYLEDVSKDVSSSGYLLSSFKNTFRVLMEELEEQLNSQASSNRNEVLIMGVALAVMTIIHIGVVATMKTTMDRINSIESNMAVGVDNKNEINFKQSFNDRERPATGFVP